MSASRRDWRDQHRHRRVFRRQTCRCRCGWERRQAAETDSGPVSLDDPNRLRHNVVLSDWKIDMPMRPDVFTSLKIAGTQRMDSAGAARRRHNGDPGYSEGFAAHAPHVRREVPGNKRDACRWFSSYTNYFGGIVQTPPPAALARITNRPTDTDSTRRPFTDTPRQQRLGTIGAQCEDCGSEWPTEGAAVDTGGCRLRHLTGHVGLGPTRARHRITTWRQGRPRRGNRLTSPDK